MSSFYTSVNLIGNNLLYIGYENGQRIQRKFKFSPTLHVISNKPTNWKTLDGRYAKPIQFDTVGEARDFKDKYKDVENFEVHGYDRFLYQYISQEFQGEVDYDIKTLKITSLDIEVACENEISLTYRNVRNRYWRSQYKIKQHVSLKYSQRGIILQVVGMLSLSIVTMRNLCYASSLLIGN